MTAVELCAGGGGQALGLEMAGFSHECLVEVDPHCVATLKCNRPGWRVDSVDLRGWSGAEFKGIELLAAGLPCPPFSIAGKQLGSEDERNLFPSAIRVIEQIRPKAILIENVRGIFDAIFTDFRSNFQKQVEGLGYKAAWRLLNASDFGVAQLRPRVAFIALQAPFFSEFKWPEPELFRHPLTVGEVLYDLMAARGWIGAGRWSQGANEIAPTIVGGSHKHGGPDLGPTRARQAWAKLGVDGISIADEAPAPDFVGIPKLTVRMCARLQGFPDTWHFVGRKTHAYRQVGNAFPPPVAKALATNLAAALTVRRSLSLAQRAA